jgi:hypothetical protein
MLRSVFEELIGWVSETIFRRSISAEKAREMLDDPVYKENVRKLVERNRRFEETRE